uniref:LysM domain-containing protein n=2 Tax=Guillardia theta TaxID=55529 RepID=A0A7S4PC33_GUITH|mmetsp:Transcript_47867/g.150130  ORF Transcript_47867/g.150130 Transcript_47867/m.150130 type:complete len:452 (+) Transcript_47867:430-1785(+)
MKLLVSILALLYITNSAAIQLCSSPGEIYNYMHQNCSEYAAPVIGTVGQDLQYPNNHEFDLPQGGVLIIRLYSVLVLSSFSNSLQFAITERTGQPEFSQFINGWLMMDGSKYVPGQVYYVCSETTIPNYNTSLYNPIETCATVKIKGFVPLLVDPTPSNGSVATAYAGQAINLRFAVNTSVIGGCDYIVNQSQCSVIEQGSACACQENCTGDCKCLQYCAPGPLPLLTVVPGMSSPMTSSGLPQSSSWALESSSPLDRPQVWRFSWTPSALDRSAAPVRMCFRASLSKTAVASNGQTLLLCVGILIDKCRHYVQPGDSLEKIAAVFQKDWLTLYHANPNLPGYSPTSLTPGHLLRLGVSYAVRWGEDMSQVSRNFLLTPLDIHLTNPELVAPVQLSYKINTGQDNVQISLSFVPRRTIAGGENVTISLPDFAGSSWSGLVSRGARGTGRRS